MSELSPEAGGKWKQLCRLLISYNDFKHAADVAHLYLNGDFDVDREEWDGGDYYERRVTGEAMNGAMIVSYARPFSGNDKAVKEKIPDIPGRYLRSLNENELRVHKNIISARNKKVAHSDSEAWEMVPHQLEMDEGRRKVVPVCNDTLRPLPKEDIRTLLSICDTFMSAIIDERKELEKQLNEYFPEMLVAESENG